MTQVLEHSPQATPEDEHHLQDAQHDATNSIGDAPETPEELLSSEEIENLWADIARLDDSAGKPSDGWTIDGKLRYYDPHGRMRIVKFDEYAAAMSPQSGTPESEPLTTIYEGPVREVVPPASIDLHATHDLAEEALLVEHQIEVSPDKEHQPLPPVVSPEDGSTVLAAINYPDSEKKIKRRYGDDAYVDTYDKTRAILNVGVANAHQSAANAGKQYAKMRQGDKLDTNIPPIRKSDAALEPFVDKPIVSVPKETLKYEPSEAEVVLTALRTAAHQNKNPGLRLSARELLSRYSPEAYQRKLYQKLVKKAITEAAADRVPKYPHHIDHEAA